MFETLESLSVKRTRSGSKESLRSVERVALFIDVPIFVLSIILAIQY